MASAIIILYDVTNMGSFEDAQFWHNSIREHCANDPLILLVGNKIDQAFSRAVPYELAERYALQNSMHFFEVSAKDATTIDRLLPYITNRVLEPEHERMRPGMEEIEGKSALA